MDTSLPPAPRFRGFLRADGAVGTRNYIAVLVTVNCAATAARRVAQAFDAERLARYPNVDGVVPFVHEQGCGMEMGGEPMDLLRRTLAGIIRNPNVAAAVVLSLGCERNILAQFLEQQALRPGPHLATIVLQEVGGTANAIAAGIAAVERMLPLADAARREPVSAGHLVVGMQVAHGEPAGPSHAALGHAADLVVRHGGTVIVSATSRLAGMAPRFVRRAASAQVADRLERRIAWWEAYSREHDTPMQRAAQGDPAHAEAEAARWGSSPLVEVYEYAHRVRAKGLVFMDTPAYEAVSATGQMAGGANLVCLATSRGSGFGTVPAPTLKVATDSLVFRRFGDDMDLDGGALLDAQDGGERIFQALLATASGAPTKGEALGVGEDEFAPWPIGITA